MRLRRTRQDVREKEAAYNAQYHQENAQDILARKRHEYQENPDYHRKRRAAYNNTHRNELNAKQRERRCTDPRYREHARRSNAKWKLLKEENAGVVTLEHKATLLMMLEYLCLGCGNEMQPHGRAADSVSWDHDLPLSRGGRDEDANLIPLCKSCNSTKKDRTFVEWKGQRLHEAAASLTF